MMHQVLGEIGMFLVLLERGLTNELPAPLLSRVSPHGINGVVFFRGGQLVATPRRLQPHLAIKIKRRALPQGVRVHPHRFDVGRGIPPTLPAAVRP